MKKRALALILVLAMFLSFSSGIVPTVRAENSLPTYNAQENFGAEVFSYYSRDVSNGTMTEMSYSESANIYLHGTPANYIGPNYLSAGANPAIGSVLIFTAPYSGTITISNAVAEGMVNKGYQWDKTNYAACYATIYSPSWSVLGSYSIPANDTPVETPDITGISVEAGQQIKFLVGSNTALNSYINWIPVISYTEVESLEHQHQWQTEWQSDESYHWHDCTSSCTVTDNAQKDGYGAHTDENGDSMCDTCSYELPQESTLPSYNANDDFGSDVFSYVSRNVTNGVNTDMSFNTTHNMYMVGSTANYIAPNFLSAGANPAISSMLIFTAPYSGTITISNAVVEGMVNKGQTWDKTNYQPCYANIYAPDWSYIATYSLPANDTPVETPDITNIQVEAGQQIKFMIGSNSTMNCYVNWIPVISYTEVESLEHQHQWQTEWQSDESYHWHDCTSSCTVTDNAQKDGYGAHTDENGDSMCDTCSYELPQESTLPSYNANDDFGSDVFSYVSRNVTNGVNTDMSFNTTHNMYMIGSTANYIAPNFLSAGANPAISSMLIFTAPYSGTVTISNAVTEGIANKGQTWDKTNYQPCYANIYAPDWSYIATYSLPANDTPVETPDITNIQVEAGQQIKFMIGSNSTMNCYVNWIPVISYTSLSEDIHEHQWQEAWSSNETHHWHECTDSCDITANSQKNGYSVHADYDVDDVCDICGHAMPVEGDEPAGDGTDLIYSFVGGYQTETADTGIWRYYVREIVTNTYTPMNYNSSTQRWEAPAAMGTAYIWQGKLHTSAAATASADYMTALQFVAPYKGTVTVSFPEGLYVSADSADGVTFAFWEDGHLKQHNNLHNGLVPGQALELESYTIDVTVGQKLNFLFHRKGSNEGDTITINPTITYLEAEVEDPADRWLDEKEPVEDSAFSFAFVPDTQGIAYYYPEEMSTIYDWIIDNVAEQNIQYVFGLGDITEMNTVAEWELAKEQIDRLNGVVPYSVVRGNHDMRNEFKQYFSDSTYLSQFEGLYNGTPADSWRTLSVNGIDFLLITLDLFASDAELAWAAEVIEAFPNHNVIITTHGYLSRDGATIATGTGFGKEYTDRQSDGNNGNEIWDKLVSKYENIRLVVCGHVTSEDVIVTQTEGANGNVVTQVLINYDDMDKPTCEEGPFGMVALFHVSEDGQTISVETYSTIREQYFKKKNQFEFEIGFTTGGSGEDGEHTHAWKEEWAGNETHHWHDCTSSCDITDNAQKDGYGAHTDENGDGKCDTCSYELPQESTLPSYNANDDFGSDVFSYVSRNVTNGVNTDMSFNTTHNMYMVGSTANYIAPNYLSAGANPAVGSMLIFTAPYSGTITISNAVTEGIANKGQTWDKTNYQTCYANIWDANWNLLVRYDLPANDTPVATPDITGIQVEAGQQIKFMVGSNSTMNCYINWIPVISYTSVIDENHEHQWQEAWSSNETHHWHECTDSCDITANSQKNGYSTHADYDVDDVCDICGHAMPVEGDEPAGDGTDLIYSFVGGYQTETADTGIWRYYVREIVTNTYTPMNYNSSTQRWEAPAAMGAAYIWQGKLHTSASATASADYMTALQFVAPYKGTVTVSFPEGLYVSADSADGVTFAFWEDGHLKQHNGLHNGLVPGQALELESYTIDVVVGQKLNFLFHRNGSNEGDTVTINPTITYLEAEIEDPADRWLDEKEPVEDSAFSFAFVPDTQGIAYHYPDEMATIYDWIIDNVDEQNIQYVFGLGDITETNVAAEWEIAKEQIDRLNGVVPYSVIRGNHDMRAEFNQYFSDSTYLSQFEGLYNGIPADSWRTLTVNGIDFLLVTLDLFASDAELAWAAEVIEAFPNHNVIITTHGYLGKDGTQIATGTGFGKEYTDRQSDGNNGDEIWDKLVSKYENIRLVVCGHISSDDVVVTQTEGANGNVVSQVLINYQHMDVPSHEEAPVGMVALFHISEDGQTISVETYSTIREQYFKKKNQFEFEIGFTTGGSGEEVEHTHAWKEEWAGNETHHWHNCTAACNIKDNAEKDGYAEHVDKILDGLCDICGHSVALPGANDHVYSYTDMYSGKQNGVWHYLMREAVTNTYKNMTWNGEMWEDGKGGFIAKDWMHASADASDTHEMQVCLEYVAPYDGVISVSMLGGTIRVAPDSQNGVRVAVWKNTDAILAYTDIGPGEAYEFAPKKVSVDEGDCIRFLVTAIAGNNAGDATFMQPIIAYKSIEYRLGPDQGFYSSMDMFSSQQTDIWQYLKRETVSGTIEELTWDGEKWIDGMGGIIAKEWMHASADGSDKHEIQMCLSFTAPSDGVVKIGMEDNVIGVSADSQNGVRVGIMQNNNLIYTYTDLSRGRNHYFEPITVNITKGDKIYFLLMPIAGNNAGDSTTLLPCITYLSYEKAPDPVLEEVPDDPSKTYYNSTDDFGGYLNPWYYTYCALGSQKLVPMTWNAQTNTFIVSEFGGLQISAAGAHPYPGYDAVRVFRAPKSGTIRLTMNNDVISLINGTTGVEDGVFVSIRLSDGASVTEVFKKTLVLPDEELAFEPIELKIYEGWELWFVVNCNTNNASDAAQYAPIVEYLEITDEKAPVYSNREEDTNEPSLDELNPDTSKDSVGNAKNNGMNIWLIVAIFVATAVVANIILILVFKRKRKV